MRSILLHIQQSGTVLENVLRMYAFFYWRQIRRGSTNTCCNHRTSGFIQYTDIRLDTHSNLQTDTSVFSLAGHLIEATSALQSTTIGNGGLKSQDITITHALRHVQDALSDTHHLPRCDLLPLVKPCGARVARCSALPLGRHDAGF